MNESYRHPLIQLSMGRESLLPPLEDQTPADCPQNFLAPFGKQVKAHLGGVAYPLKHRLQRHQVQEQLREIGVPEPEFSSPDVICWGLRGFGPDVFLNRIKQRVKNVTTVLCFGCGLGYEVLQVAAHLRPQKIIGYEYFNYRRAWDFVSDLVKSRYGVETEFKQVDLSNPRSQTLDRADLLFSFCVLEHLRDMEENFAYMRALLNPGGYFASLWGPMWYSYGGDHISPELGFSMGYQHVILSPDEYFDYYKSHPRNREMVKRGEPTWLELGLHNYARYSDYLLAINSKFGSVEHLTWQISPEAFRWRELAPETWEQMLGEHSHLNPLDLVLQGASVICQC